ncbi:unnamed protein product [Notodromas monacha]|uniref:U8 snoRNA-decapping enzyme n=1 Tax=Notodromas monacha TaxID=399045 RepID=A0A7R9BZY0_9CRUS|nr:unnamed protein product [Notodromas monacha]CAG0923659.1 unnamed protein product [Notodromas monacha]
MTELSWEEAVNAPYVHCAHCFIFARSDRKVLYDGRYAEKALVLMQLRFDGRFGFPGGIVEPGEDVVVGLQRELKEVFQIALVLMQLRFDGRFGFPGGIVEPGEDVVVGLQRELKEESNLDDTRFKLEAKDWLGARLENKGGCRQPVVLHFFALEVTRSEFRDILKAALQIDDDEVCGHVKVPLYTMREDSHDNYGFPLFLKNQFAGQARDQLLEALVKLGVMTQDEVDAAVTASALL